MTFKLTSPAFAEGGEIPRRYTCEDADVSPPLAWTGIPAGTRSLALLVEDPDAPDPAAPQTIWVHWILYDLPASVESLPEDVEHRGLPPGARCGENDWQDCGYGGPCPPIGQHRYFHRLFALDALLGDLGSPDKRTLMRAIEGHVLAEAVLIGRYRKAPR